MRKFLALFLTGSVLGLIGCTQPKPITTGTRIRVTDTDIPVVRPTEPDRRTTALLPTKPGETKPADKTPPKPDTPPKENPPKDNQPPTPPKLEGVTPVTPPK